MNSFPDYKAATNAAYQLLASKSVFSLSTDVFEIVGNLPKCRLLTYGQAKQLYHFTDEMLLGQSEFGFTFIRRSDKARVIIYNEEKSQNCIRFTVAHEIGHAVLGHSEEELSWEEKEANCFARNLLCPIPIVDGLEIDTILDYVTVFKVTEQMASVAYDRSASDRYYISENLRESIDEKLYAYLHGFEKVNEFYMRLYA